MVQSIGAHAWLRLRLQLQRRLRMRLWLRLCPVHVALPAWLGPPAPLLGAVACVQLRPESPCSMCVPVAGRASCMRRGGGRCTN